ncbi:hypothetical protein [Arenibacterium halophilum]|uniref:Cation/multidrug efflux pump n=1 Tax=Arenibacterium halophilum TaxID=2583821 RepID=A0ABY2XG71_9RHOB|nr:hypothetical protein [Arenibacterium halophilum]TMV15626.1 hypothetical protein FGK64_06655 [Arenibacterium halophilum]
MALIRLIFFGFIGLTIVYFLVSIYSRSVRREKLEKAWAEEHPESDNVPARDAYVAEGMEQYEKSLRHKLILLVYVVPVALVIGIHIVTTYT